MKTAHMAFVGRKHLLDRCRQAVDAGQALWLTGEHGVGKTTLAKRVTKEAIYIPNVTPVKELLASILLECWRRDWYAPATKDGEPGDTLDEAAAEKVIRRLDVRSAGAAAVDALRDNKAVLVLDDFDGATVTVIRLCRRLAEVATLVVCAVAPRPAQQPFLFGFQRVDVPRLTQAEGRDLVERLLSEHQIPPAESARLTRHLIEEAQGLPSVAHELVKRAAIKGAMSLRAVRQEPLSGHRTVDMTPALVIFAALLVAFRVAFRGAGDHDLTVLMGSAGVLFMVVRFYAGRLSARRR